MEGEGLAEVAEDGVAAGEAGQEGIVPAGAEVVPADFFIVVPASEAEGIREGAVAIFHQGFAEGAVGIYMSGGSLVVDEQTRAAETVMDIEVFGRRLVTVMLQEQLADGIRGFCRPVHVIV